MAFIPASRWLGSGSTICRRRRQKPGWVADVHQEVRSKERARAPRVAEKKHGLGRNSAWWLAERAEGKGGEDDDPEAYLRAAEGYVEKMFADPRQSLRPIYDALLKLGLSIGKDVKACPCQTIVPLYRNHVFAQIKPATQTRIDMGFALKDLKATGRLIDTEGFAKKDRITHRIPITSLADIDDEVKHWLKHAYALDA